MKFIKKFILIIIKILLNSVNYISTYLKFKKQWSQDKTNRFSNSSLFPCLFDNTNSTGFDRHYVFHTAWAARCLKSIMPPVHVDISSSLYFCTIASAFIPIKFYDYRPAKLSLSNLEEGSQDLLKLSFQNESISSLSCMHVIEHIGLGRYGDAVDFNGDLKAILELKRVLKTNGDLLFVVPIGVSKIEFNAHRIYSVEQVLNLFSDLKLIEFSFIPDDPSMGIITNALNQISVANSQKYACGLFWFKKI